MRSKNWSFNLSLPVLRKDLTRFWPVWGSYLAIWLLILPIPLLNDLDRDGQLLPSIHSLIVSAGSSTALVMSLIFGGLSAFAVWSYLYQGRSASLFHALPVDRDTLFRSHFAAGLCSLLGVNLVIALLTWFCQLSAGSADPTLLLQWLLIVSLENLLFFSIGTVAAHLTGNLPTMPVLYALLNFAIPACETLMIEFACSLYYGVNSIDMRLSWLSPFIYLVGADASMYMEQTGDITVAYRLRQFNPEFLRLLVLYALAALALTAIALLLYRRRATESAGDVIAVPWLRPVAKYAFSLGCALVLGWIFHEILFSGEENALSILLALLLGAVIGYLTAAMLLKKSFRVFLPRQLLGFVPVVLALGLWITALHFDLFNIQNHVPDSNDVLRATINCEYQLTVDQPQDLFLVEELHRTVLRYGRESVPGSDMLHFSLKYELENGTTLRRSYSIPYSEALSHDLTAPAGALARLMRQPEHAVAGNLPPVDAIYQDIDLSLMSIQAFASPNKPFEYDYCMVYPMDGRRLTAALREDMLAGRIGVWNPTWSDRDAMFSLSFCYSLPGQSNTDLRNHITIWTDEQPTRTLEVLTKLGYLTEVPDA